MSRVTTQVLLVGLVALTQARNNTNPSHFTSPLVLPSPEIHDAVGSDVSARVEEFLSKLNLTQKVSLCTGGVGYNPYCNGNIDPIPSLNFSGLCLQDGPAGVRIADLASVFPAGLTAAASWDRDLMYARGAAMGMEFRTKGAHIMLGPVAGPLGRHPLGGRNWEGFSPDPYLTGVAMERTIRGTQDQGVQAVAKHFIGNEQEEQRSNVVHANGTNIEAISSNIDDRTMHELYLWPFANAVRAGVAAMMCSYNRVNQTYACENSKLLNGLLKEELGFSGYVVSDWNAVHNGVQAANAGMDMLMPGPIAGENITGPPIPSFFGGNLTRAVMNGSVDARRVDDIARRILTPYFALGQDRGYPTVDVTNFYVLAATYSYPDSLLRGLGLDPESPPPARDARSDHASLIRRFGAEGVVLLKNTNATLPLQTPKNIGVFGNDAGDDADGLVFTGDGAAPQGFEFGVLSIGSGSGTGRHTYIVSPLEAIQSRARVTGARVQYLLNNQRIAAGDFSSIFPRPEVCLVFLKTFSREGADRLSFENDWNSTFVVEQVAAHCPNTVVITHSAGVNTMPWADNENVTAIVAAHYQGQETGNSIADVLFGDINPSGRLPYTIPRTATDYDIPVFNLTGPARLDTSAWQSDFTEGLLIDYRHFDANQIEPLYEFGFGLSYTSFELTTPLAVYSQSTVIPAFPAAINETHLGGNPSLWEKILSLGTTVQNVGDTAGAQVVQLYLSYPRASVPEGTPVQVLRGFEKIKLEPGESGAVAFSITRRDLSFWNTTAQDWQIPSGAFSFHVGFSSRDLNSSASVEVC